MPPGRLVGVLVLGAALAALRPAPAAAQSELQMWLNPELGKQIPRADYRYTFYPDRKVEDQEAHFGMAEHRATLFTPFYQDDRNEWGLSLKALYQNIDTEARFPDAGGLFPDQLWDLSAGIGFEVTGGWAFNRFYFEGEGYSDRHDNRIDVGDAPFVVGKMNLRF